MVIRVLNQTFASLLQSLSCATCGERGRTKPNGLRTSFSGLSPVFCILSSIFTSHSPHPLIHASAHSRATGHWSRDTTCSSTSCGSFSNGHPAHLAFGLQNSFPTLTNNAWYSLNIFTSGGKCDWNNSRNCS